MKQSLVKFIRKLFLEILSDLSIEEISSNTELMKCVERIDVLLCV